MKADTITKDFISDTSVFADVFNYYIYSGEQMILPEQLKERDTVEIALPYGTDGALVPIQRFRDKQNLCTVMTDGTLEYVLFGAEAQAEIQYAMPVKNNLYDVLDYAGQVEETAKSHRKAMLKKRRQKKEAGTGEAKELGAVSEKTKTPNSGEFLSGFWKEDRLIPSLTVTIYFGCEEWDGPLSLFDMLEVKDPRILSHLDNYRVHPIAPAQMKDEEIMKLQSNLREVLLFIKYSKDKEKLDRILESGRDRFRELERRAVNVIEVITGLELKYNESEVKVDMCQAIVDMRAEERQIGREEGRKEMCQAISEMRAEERQIGREEGREEERQKMHQTIEEERQKTAQSFYQMGLDIETISLGLNVSPEIVRQWIDSPADAARE